MRAEQFQKLQELTEKLTDLFIKEADPDTWPGKGIDLANMDQQTRGNLYWSKKNAAATLTVIMRTSNLINVIQMRSDIIPTAEDAAAEEETSLDSEIAAAEKEAQKMLSKIQSTARTATGKKVHGQ